jgi:hypothetical protein
MYSTPWLWQIDDLYERRIDTWIRDFVGATHVLDVYRQKRVDKRKVGKPRPHVSC